MRKFIVLFFALFLSVVSGNGAVEPAPAPATQALTAAERLPGVDLAEGVSQLTGVAISPLLGMCSVGAWHYFKTPGAERHFLPWFCHPVVWGAGFVLLALCFLKDLAGTAAPPLLKKPLDMAELFESKVSALVACSAFLPFVVAQMARYAPPHTDAAVHGTGAFLASIPLDSRVVTLPLAIIGFLTVWLAGHTINVLIALCPFGFIDTLLKLLKLGLLALVSLSSFASPVLGAIVSLTILFVASLIAPWAFRLSFFGARLAGDFVLPWRGVHLTEPHVFLARPLGDLPVRTNGRLVRNEFGEVIFLYRPWLFLPRRAVAVPTGSVAVAKGLLYPSLLHRAGDHPRMKTLAVFLPRYRSHEQTVAGHLGIAEVQESTLIQGWRAVRRWFAETLGLGRATSG